MHYDFREII